MLATTCYIIFCFRAKQKPVILSFCVYKMVAFPNIYIYIYWSPLVSLLVKLFLLKHTQIYSWN